MRWTKGSAANGRRVAPACALAFWLGVGALGAQDAELPPAVLADRCYAQLRIPADAGAARMQLWQIGPDAVPVLVRALRDKDDAVAIGACAVLHEMGAEAGAAAKPHLERLLQGAKGPRRRALEWALHGVTTTGFAVTEWGTSKLVLLDARGEVLRRLDAVPQAWDVQSLPGGRLLVTQVGSNEVREIDLDGQEHWKFATQQPHRARRLPGGTTLIASTGDQRVVEVDAAGTVVWQVEKIAAEWVHRLLDGNTLVLDRSGKRLVEFAPDGDTVRSFAIPSECYGAQRLPDGNTLVAARDGRVHEYDTNGKEIASTQTLAGASACLRLRDGTTLVAGQTEVAAFDRTWKALWRTPVQWAGGISR